MEQQNKGKKCTKKFLLKNHPNWSGITRFPGLVLIDANILMLQTQPPPPPKKKNYIYIYECIYQSWCQIP